MQLSDWQLIQQCKQGDGDAWQLLVGRYERLVHAIPRRYGMTGEDSADVAQLTFTLMLEQLHTFHDQSNVKGWLGTVARRHSWRVLQRYDHEKLQSPEDLQLGMELMGYTTPDSTQQLGIVEWLHDGMQLLGERCRQLLSLLYLDESEPAYDEIATQLDMRRGSIGPTRKRCLDKLKANLESAD